MSSNTSTRFAFCVNTARFLINRVLCCSRRATRRKSSATFRLNALMACRLLSATEHHTLQQAGRPSGARGKRRKNGGDEEALCPRDLLQQTQQHCENSETYCYSDRKSRFFFFLRLCIPVCMPEGYTQYYEKDLSWHKSQSLHRRCGGGRGGGGEMNYSTSQRCSALKSCCVLWGGEATTSSTSS